MRLTSENLDLEEKFDALPEQCRKYRKQIRLLAKKLKDAGVESVTDGDAVPFPAGILPQNQCGNLPVVHKKERDYMDTFQVSQGRGTHHSQTPSYMI
jgi:myosin-5